MPSDVISTQRRTTEKPARHRSNSLLVILNWGPSAWYWATRSSTTVGELRRAVAKAVGRMFDGEVVGLELVGTDSGISPELTTSLSQLAHPPHRNVCFDVRSTSGSRLPAATSIGEQLLRRHLHQEHFQAGIDRRRWRLIDLSWPYAIFGLRSKQKVGHYREASLRLKLDKYPLAPPRVECWNAETRSAIEATDWPEWFSHFVSQSYPQFVEIEPALYSPNLLSISTVVATRLKRPSEAWDVSRDLTQVLIRASRCFRTSQSRSGRSALSVGRDGKLTKNSSPGPVISSTLDS